MPECQSKTIPRGVSFAGMAVFFPVPSGGQLSGMGGQFHRNRGSVWSGINTLLPGREKAEDQHPDRGVAQYIKEIPQDISGTWCEHKRH